MLISPVATNNFNSQPLSATESRSVLPQVSDTLAQAGSSPDGFIMSILKPIGRFFVNLVSYFKYICCCCPTKETKGPDLSMLPKLSVEQIESHLESHLDEGYEVTKKSDTLFAVKQGGIDFTIEMVPYGKSFAVQIEGGDDLWENGDAYDFFKDSSAVILKGLKKNSDINYAENAGFIKEGSVWVKKGPVESILPFQMDRDNYEIFFGEASIHLRDEGENYNWVITGLDKCPQHLSALIKWAKPTFYNNEQLVVKHPSSDLAKELEKHGFVKTDTTYTYALHVRDDSDE